MSVRPVRGSTIGVAILVKLPPCQSMIVRQDFAECFHSCHAVLRGNVVVRHHTNATHEWVSKHLLGLQSCRHCLWRVWRLDAKDDNVRLHSMRINDCLETKSLLQHSDAGQCMTS